MEETKNDYNNTGLKLLHIINSLITMALLVISFVSFFYIGKDVITYDDKLTNVVVIFRVSIPSFIFIFALVFALLGMIFPSKPYFLNQDQNRNIKNMSNTAIAFTWIITLLGFANGKGKARDVLFAGAITSALSDVDEIKYVRRIWCWWVVLIVFIMTFFMSWFLLAISNATNATNSTLLSPFVENGFNSVYNSLCTINIGLLILLIITSMIWKISMDKVHKNDKYWNRVPIIWVIFSLVYVVVIVMIAMYFNLGYWRNIYFSRYNIFSYNII